MRYSNLDLNLLEAKRNSCKDAIEFYIRHLDERELEFLEQMAQKLAETYSSSYREFKYGA